MKQHYVEFYSPGTLFAETTMKEIDSWDVDAAIAMADEIIERHGATPFGFRFVTRERTDDELDAKRTASSGMHHLGGVKLTLAQVKARRNPKDRTLISNMEVNDIPAVVENRNSWLSTQPFNEGDTLLDYTPPSKR